MAAAGDCRQPPAGQRPARGALRRAPRSRPSFSGPLGISLPVLNSRPTSRVGTQRVQIASGMPNRGSRPFLTLDPESWLSTQVYTSFGRAAVLEIIFSRISQVVQAPSARSFGKSSIPLEQSVQFCIRGVPPARISWILRPAPWASLRVGSSVIDVAFLSPRR